MRQTRRTYQELHPFPDRPDLRPGERVNLERPLRLGDGLDGHLVQGHVAGDAMRQAKQAYDREYPHLDLEGA